jgi:hypothetical protein
MEARRAGRRQKGKAHMEIVVVAVKSHGNSRAILDPLGTM